MESAKNSVLTRASDPGKKLLFRLKWAVMSQDKRYAYLWAKTKKSLAQADPSPISRN